MTIYITPYRRVSAMRRAMDRAMDENMAAMRAEAREMKLAVEVKAGDEGYELRAMVPGLDAGDLNIEILNKTITLSGEFKSVDDDKAQYLTAELPGGRFSRTVTLPADLDAGKAEARLENGVLHLFVPKAESARPKTIKVSMND